METFIGKQIYKTDEETNVILNKKKLNNTQSVSFYNKVPIIIYFNGKYFE